MGTSPDEPQVPALAARIDYVFASAPAGEVTNQILDAAGRPVRTFSNAAPGAPAAGGPLAVPGRSR